MEASTKMVDQVIPYVIGDRSVGTSTVATQLSGDQSGNATNFTAPPWLTAIGKIRPYNTIATPTAAQTVWTSVIPSSGASLPIGFYEVMCQPLGSPLGALSTYLQAGQNNAAQPIDYPWNLGLPAVGGSPLSGANGKLISGVQITFNGQAQVANTVAPRVGAVLWLHKGGHNTSFGGGPWYSLWGSKGQNASNPTTSATTNGTTNAAVPLPIIPGTGSIKIRKVLGIFTPNAYAITDDVVGWFTIPAGVLPVPMTWANDPQTGSLGATAQVMANISRVDDIYQECPLPVQFQYSFSESVASIPAAAGQFEVGIMYQY